DRCNTAARIDRRVLPRQALSGCTHGVEQAGRVAAEELERVNARARTAGSNRRCDGPGRRNSVRDGWTAVDVCVLVRPGVAGVDGVHELRRENVPFFDVDEMIARAIEFRPVWNIRGKLAIGTV